jgi:uncharacterized membrane protein
MDQKKFKNLRESITIQLFDAGKATIEVKRSINSFDVYVNDFMVEAFKTEKMALEVAKEAADAIRNELE